MTKAKGRMGYVVTPAGHQALAEARLHTRQRRRKTTSLVWILDTLEILRLFEAYGFKDAKGHDLTQCQDFLDLVDRAAGEMAT